LTKKCLFGTIHGVLYGFRNIQNMGFDMIYRNDIWIQMFGTSGA